MSDFVRITVDFNECTGKIKPMHATNNGPIITGGAFGKEVGGTVKPWIEAGIPYARTHDSSHYPAYGGEHTVDVHAIFPNFDADVNDPASYDFPVTDAYLKCIIDCGTKVFYRLGTKIEHYVKKYNIHPPKDFKKWAEICEHIIRHYTEGWADGFFYDIEYWEIWNEPDLDPEDAPRQRTWSGTDMQFYHFYEVAATHLKACFPHLKIGGPACAFRKPWFEGFLDYITHDGKRVPMDFFSWHCYGATVEKIYERSAYIREALDAHGYADAESILDEWNYVQSWDRFDYSVRQIISMKGAAFSAACMCGCQSNTSVDMLMYYDARPTRMNGIFDFYTNEPMKGYYPFKMFCDLYRLGASCKITTDCDDIYAAAAKNEDDTAVMISYYTDDDNATDEREIILKFIGGAEAYSISLLDNDHNAEEIGRVISGEKITLLPNTVCLLKSVK